MVLAHTPRVVVIHQYSDKKLILLIDNEDSTTPVIHLSCL